jgi:hypothetical protein
MKQKETNYLTMTGSVIQLLEDNSEKWQDITHIANSVQQIKSTANSTREAARIQDKSNTKGYTNEKHTLFLRMTLNIEKLVRKARAYARMNKDEQLLNLVDHSLSSIQDGSDEETLIRCENIAAGVENIKDTLISEFGLDETILAQINEDITAIRNLVNQRTDTNSKGTAATASIKDNIKELRTHFELLDDLVYGIIDDNDFLKIYSNTRQIIDR